jgi:hypothetical protein
MRQYLSLPTFGNVPHPRVLPIVKHKAKVGMNLNIYRLQESTLWLQKNLGIVFGCKFAKLSKYQNRKKNKGKKKPLLTTAWRREDSYA